MEWNSKEKKELIKLYPKYTAKELEVKFKRSSKAIHRMANLKLPTKFPRAYMMSGYVL